MFWVNIAEIARAKHFAQKQGISFAHYKASFPKRVPKHEPPAYNLRKDPLAKKQYTKQWVELRNLEIDESKLITNLSFYIA